MKLQVQFLPNPSIKKEFIGGINMNNNEFMNKTVSLYAIENRIYSHEQVELRGLVDDIEYAFVDTELIDLGNKVFLITDNDVENCEIIQEINDGVYNSITIFHISLLEQFIGNFSCK